MAKNSSRKKVRRSSGRAQTVRRGQSQQQPRPDSRKRVPSAGAKPASKKAQRPASGKGQRAAGRTESRGRPSDTGYKTAPQAVSGRIRGMSLTVKFSLWIGFMIAFFMLAFAVVMYIQVEKNLYREKKFSGMYFSNALVPLGVAYLSFSKSTEGIPQETMDDIKRKFDAILALQNEGIVNVAVTQAVGGQTQFLPGLGKPISIAPDTDPVTLDIDGQPYDSITIQEGRTKTDTAEKVFWFTKTDTYGGDTLKIFVILSMKSIEQSQKRLVTQIAGIGIGFVILGFLVAYALAAVAVKPVRQLVHDMAVVSSGKLDHRTTAHSRDEIGLLANTFNLMTKSLLEAREIEKEKLLIDSELTVASDIQARLLPEKTPQIAGYQIVPFYRSAKDVGGDYYDFIPLDRDHLGIVVADVSGKGIIGSLVMSITRTVLRLVSQHNFSAADTLSKTNYVIAQDIRRGMFVTAFYVIINLRKREIIYSSAGHNPMVLYRSEKRKVELANPKGIALGFNKGPIFDKTVKEERLQLNSGDMIVLYTDGVVEAMDIHNNEYTEERFYKFTLEHARESADEYVNKLVTDLDAFSGNAPQSDDITIVALKVE